MICCRCKIDKEESEFNWKISEKKKQPYCRLCNSEYLKNHYKNNKEYYKNKASVSKLKARDVIWNYLSTHECVDCGESNPLVLEFDHVNGQKLRDVCTSKYYGVTITLQEIEKCEVRCANCHRKKTALQLGWWKDKL